MDAATYIKQAMRMCRAMPADCIGCPAINAGICAAVLRTNTMLDMKGHEEKAVAIVEKWAKEHPIKTRKNKLLKMFPNADAKIISTFLSPCHLDKTENPQRCAKYGYISSSCRCIKCRDDYWDEEVSE